MSRADKHSILGKMPEYYSDFPMTFDVNPLTGFLARVTNEESVKHSIRNLILTDRTERFYNPSIGSKIHSLLFEPLDSVTSEMIRSTIEETIKNNEPRVILQRIDVVPYSQDNAYYITVFFSIINIPDKDVSLSVILNRVR